MSAPVLGRRALSALKIEAAITDDPFLTLEEAAEFLRSTPGAVKNLVWRKKLRAYKPQKRLLIKKSELIRFIESSLSKGG